MIRNDRELEVTRNRISYFLDLLTKLRANSRPEEFSLVTSGYRAEVEKMQRDVLEYLEHQSPESSSADERQPANNP